VELKYTLLPGKDDARLGRQDFAYGRFEWIRLPDESTPDGIMIARCTIEPGREWPEHWHTGYEQMLFVVSGSGVHSVNGEKRELHPGVVEFLPVGASHYVLNTGDEPLTHLSVYHPITPKEVRELALDIQGDEVASVEEQIDPIEFLRTPVMQSIQDKFAAAVGLGVVTVDVNGSLVTEPTRLPSFCRYVQQSSKAIGRCPAFDPCLREHVDARGYTMLNCCPGVACVVMPLNVNGELLGYMVCGFVKIEQSDESHLDAVRRIGADFGLDEDILLEYYEEMEVVLKAQIVAAAESLQSIANAIVSSQIRETQRHHESEYHAEMVKKLQAINSLEHDLQEAEFRALEARINPHFLFNALNTIAEAVSKSDESGEDMVYALSEFLRFSLSNTCSTTTLSQEIKCLENYLRIQHARFGSGLRTEITVEPPNANPVVPSMILQPLVENAIVHGLSSLKYEGLVKVAAVVDNGWLTISVSDTGVGFNEDMIIDFPNLSFPQRKRQGLGLRYVRTKLQHTFGDEYVFSVESLPGHGTTVFIEMPAKESDIL